MLYIVKDGYNNDIVYKGNSKDEAKKAINKYSECCDGDWVPVVKKIERLDFLKFMYGR